MFRQTSNSKKINRIVGLAILSAIIIVLQIICTFVKFGPVNITLALAPIVIGTALYGIGSGAFLGFVLGLVVLVAGLFGWDGGFVLLLMDQHAFITIVICIIKTTLAGLAAGAVYKALEKKNTDVAVLVSGAVCPIVNTGLFILGMFVFFMPMLRGFAESADKSVVIYALTGFAGINFVVEFIVNIVLASAISRIIRAVKANKLA